MERQSAGLCRCVVVVVMAVGLMWFGWTSRGLGEGAWGGPLEHLQSSVAVCFKFGLGSLHRLDLVMSHFGVKRKRTGLRART